jgi:hypothetical protein
MREAGVNVYFRSKDWRERILSNFAHTPFKITINGQEFECNSVEGFWQGLKCDDEKRRQVFLLSGPAAKRAGAGKKAPTFTMAGREYRVGSDEHAGLILEATRQKILQNPQAAQALKESNGILTHNVPRMAASRFKMEELLRQLYWELFGEGRRVGVPCP